MYLHLTLHKNDIIFLTWQTLVRDYYATEFLYSFFYVLTISNIKTKNYKAAYLI
jgi:hypothetical protein